jgi:NAD(P)-dependent dehydrogenase (short-subunit alcohol dehydrogenase family)
MTEQHYGRIINIASQAGVAPSPNAPSYLPYAAAKAGVIGFTKLLARDVGQFGITVNAISPGTTATERVVRIRGPETLQNMASLNPMRKLVEPEDSAATAAFLASDDARLITGTNINVNAGTVM